MFRRVVAWLQPSGLPPFSSGAPRGRLQLDRLSGQRNFVSLGHLSHQLVEIEAEDGPLTAGAHHLRGARRGSVESISVAFYRPDSTLDLSPLFDELLLDGLAYLPRRLAQGGQSDLFHPLLSQLDDILPAVAGTVVGIGLWGFAEQGDVLIHRPESEFCIHQLSAVLGHR